MRGIVWGLTFDAAKEQLGHIERDYELYHTAKLVRKIVTRWEYRLEYDNDDDWRAVGAAENRRGMKCNVSYVDARIDANTLECIIKPCTIAGPYHAINYFYPDITVEEIQ